MGTTPLASVPIACGPGRQSTLPCMAASTTSAPGVTRHSSIFCDAIFCDVIRLRRGYATVLLSTAPCPWGRDCTKSCLLRCAGECAWARESSSTHAQCGSTSGHTPSLSLPLCQHSGCFSWASELGSWAAHVPARFCSSESRASAAPAEARSSAASAEVHVLCARRVGMVATWRSRERSECGAKDGE